MNSLARRFFPRIAQSPLAVLGGLLLIASSLPTRLFAEVSLPSVFGDNMVLQREIENPIWGKAGADEQVTVTFAGKSVETKADENGRWRTTLPKLPANHEGRELVITGSGGSEIIFQNVLVGEVWFFSGPSNILWPVRACDNPKEEIAAADFPGIRFFKTGRLLADTPQEDCEGEWSVCSPRTVGVASGVAYFFSRKIHREVGVPIGVLQSFWSSSRVEGWTSEESVHGEPELKPIVDWWQEALAGYDEKAESERHRLAMEAWSLKAAAAKQAGAPEPAKPRAIKDPAKSTQKPGRLFNGMVAPLIPFGIRGAVTYQGLGNLYWAEHGQPLMAAMFRDWRKQWGQGDFPIGMVQPAPFDCERYAKQHPEAYMWQRESQLLILEDLPNMGLAPTMDIGEIDEIHFRNKQDVGRRMALWALAEVYERDVQHAGPIYDSMEIEGSAIRIRFKNVGPENFLTTSDGKSPTEFTIAGEDGSFLDAEATISEDGTSVVVQNESVAKPIAVRFAWSNIAIPNLFNEAGLPASLFRTDRSQ